MKAHVEVAEGRWLPSRYHYALFRLTAFLILRRSVSGKSTSTDRRYVLIIDRDQNPVESFALSIFLVIWSSACLSVAAIRYRGAGPLLAAVLFPILLIVMPLMLQVILYVVSGLLAICRRAGLPLAEASHQVQTSVFFVAMLFVAAIAAGSGRSALALLGWILFSLLGLNGAAAILMLLLAKPVANTESLLRETPSDL